MKFPDSDPVNPKDDRSALAASYALNACSEEERLAFEIQMERDPSLLDHVTLLLEVVTGSVLNAGITKTPPPEQLRKNVMQVIDQRIGIAKLLQNLTTEQADCLVFTDAESRVLWVNDSFARMCGFSNAELSGHKPSELLHGEGTEIEAVARIRQAVQLARPHCDQITNYRKNGESYRVRLSINPVIDFEGRVSGFFSLQREC